LPDVILSESLALMYEEVNNFIFFFFYFWYKNWGKYKKGIFFYVLDLDAWKYLIMIIMWVF
jgi:hypothetical protein